jgi:hypothetical protein
MRHRRFGSAFPGAVLLVVLAALLWLPGVAQAARPLVQKPAPHLTAQWWQTYMATPGDSFSRCDLGVDAVVFLAGTTGHAATRSCSIPAGRSLLVPLINAECSTLEGDGTTPAQLRACARGFADRFTGLVLKIDGRAVPDLRRLRVASPVFSFTAVPGNVFGVPSGTTRSVADGYWALIRPLPPGTHTVTFGGRYPPGSFSTSVRYRLTVR